MTNNNHNVETLNEDFTVLGQVAWLWANSSLHSDWSMSLFSRNIIPAIHYNQYVLLMRDGFPIAFCSWANMSLDSEVKYVRDVTSLGLEDWNSGPRKWIIDWIAPFGDNHTLYKYMRQHFPNEVFRAIRVQPESESAKIIHVQGGKTNKQETRKLINQYQQELMAALNLTNNRQ